MSSANEAQVWGRGQSGPQTGLSTSNVFWMVLRLAALCIVDAFALLLAVSVINDGQWLLGIMLILTALGATVINLVPGLWPLRWMTPSLVLVALMALYPMLYTVYLAFTNFREGHRFTKPEMVERLLTDRQYFFLPEGGTSYQWTALYNETDGTYALWLRAADGRVFFATQYDGETPGDYREIPADELATLELDSRTGAPADFEGYRALARLEAANRNNHPLLQPLATNFGAETEIIGIRSASEAGAFEPGWAYDAENDVLTNRQTGYNYYPDEAIGSYFARRGGPQGAFITESRGGVDYKLETPLGYWTDVGFANFTLLFETAIQGGVLIRIFLWTVAYAFLAVLMAFAFGLALALALNKPFRGVRIVRSLLIIPWAVPGMIGILTWRGMMNPNFGVIMTTLKNNFGLEQTFDWTIDPFWAKVVILFVNLWFAFPYFMLISSGALQSISSSIYEAAEVDGANAWTRFWKLTLPLLLVAMGPLLIGSFTYNFNNYLLIAALTDGGPAMQGIPPPVAGHTDLLITYTYRYAFSGSAGAGNYSFASAISIVIFLMVALITVVQFRLTKRWEAIGENV